MQWFLSFHSLHKDCLAQWPAFCDPQNGLKIAGGYFQKNWVGVRHASWNPSPISDQKLWFSLPYFRPIRVTKSNKGKKFDTLF